MGPAPSICITTSYSGSIAANRCISSWVLCLTSQTAFRLFQVTVRVVDLERPKCDFASGSPYRNCAFALRHIDTDGGNNSSFHFSDLL